MLHRSKAKLTSSENPQLDRPVYQVYKVTYRVVFATVESNYAIAIASFKAGSHIIAAIVSIAAVNSKSGLTIGTII